MKINSNRDNTILKDIRPLETIEADGKTMYVAPPGYTLEGGKAVKKTG